MAPRLISARVVLLCWALAGTAAGADELRPLVAAGALNQQAWIFHGLSDGTPATRFEPTRGDGAPALRVTAERSYGLLLHELAAGFADLELSWRWAVIRDNPAATLLTRATDDSPLKVCALYDLPLSGLPFGARQRLRLARWLTGLPLPAATVCYVWNAAHAAGTVLPNPYSDRVRSMVLRASLPPAQGWRRERRPLAADFARAFGSDAGAKARLVGIAIGADADDTGGESASLISGLTLQHVAAALR